MGTAIENAKELRVKIADAKSRGANVQILHAWAPVRQRLDAFLSESEELVKAATLLIREAELLSGQVPKPRELASIQAKFEKLEKRLNEEPSQFLEDNVWPTAKAQLENLAKALRDGLLAAWESYLKSKAQSIEYLEPFASVGHCKPIILKIKTELAALRNLVSELPEGAEPFRSAVRHQKEIQKLIQQLDLKDVPKHVQDFLKRINTTSGATLADLTPEVRKWLESKDMLKSFQIRPF
jgi:hypothetical protein